MNDKEMIRTFKGNLVDYIRKLKETEEKNNQLQSNWNSLREYLKIRLNQSINGIRDDEIRKALDKMNELEKRNEN